MPTRECRRGPLTQTLCSSDVVEVARARVPSIDPDGETVLYKYMTVPATSSSPERPFSSVGLVKSDWWGRLLDTTLIDVMWTKQVP